MPRTNLRIPDARDQLLSLAARCCDPGMTRDIIAQQIRGVVQRMFREKYVRKAPKCTIKVTADIVRGVKSFEKEHPEAAMRLIGRQFGIDQGRVSEILTGLRTVRQPGGTAELRATRAA